MLEETEERMTVLRDVLLFSCFTLQAGQNLWQAIRVGRRCAEMLARERYSVVPRWGGLAMARENGIP